ncbi:MAG: hypothetical protein JF598_04090, partial [Streptomyces sp.]|nr:hypothetical protein [Streptomyces sp.]
PDGYRIAYQQADHVIRTVDSSGARNDTGLTGLGSTSPAITTLPTGEIDLSVIGSDNKVRVLSTTGSDAVIDTGATAANATSPTIAPAAGGGFVTAWADQGARLDYFTPGGGLIVTGLGLAFGSSPAWGR